MTQRTLEFDAAALALGWLSVSVAASSDKDRPALYRTVSIEGFPPHGVRLVSTDSYMLLHSWVPALDEYGDWNPDVDAPALEEVPEVTAVARDVHGRARSLMGHLLGVANGERKSTDPSDSFPIPVSLGFGGPDDSHGGGTFAGMAADAVVINHPGHERLRLRCYEGDFPNWRAAVAGFRPVPTRALALTPDLVGRVVKAASPHPDGTLIVWQPGGATDPMAVELLNAEPDVRGLVMPCRWDFELNRPWVEPDPEEDPTEGGEDGTDV